MCFDTKALGSYHVVLSVMHACEVSGLSKKGLSTMQPRYQLQLRPKSTRTCTLLNSSKVHMNHRTLRLQYAYIWLSLSAFSLG
jgi:hypothetical protein